MKIVIGSLNPAKIDAARLAFAELFPGIVCQFSGVAAESGVAAQPMTDHETFQGARNRAFAAKAQQPEADLWIGMEGGVAHYALAQHDATSADTIAHCITFAWIQVLGPNLDNASRSASLTLPPMVAQALVHGEELGPAMDRLFMQQNSKQKGGTIGILTKHSLTRRSVYRDTLILALAPLLSPEAYT